MHALKILQRFIFFLHAFKNSSTRHFFFLQRVWKYFNASLLFLHALKILQRFIFFLHAFKNSSTRHFFFLQRVWKYFNASLFFLQRAHNNWKLHFFKTTRLKYLNASLFLIMHFKYFNAPLFWSICLNQSEKIREIIKKNHASYLRLSVTALIIVFFFTVLCWISLSLRSSVVLRCDYSYIFFPFRRPYSLSLSLYSLHCRYGSSLTSTLLSLWSFVVLHCPYSPLLSFVFLTLILLSL